VRQALARLHSGGSLNRSHACTAEGGGSSATPTGVRFLEGKDSELVLGGITDFETVFRNVRTDAKVDDLRFHDFRHAFVTRSIIVGVPLAAITAASGHISDEWQRYANPSYDGVKSLLLPHKDQTEAEVKEYAKTVLDGLKNALGYNLDELLK